MSADAAGILLSFAEVKDQCGDRVGCNAKKDQFDIQICDIGLVYHFKRTGKI